MTPEYYANVYRRYATFTTNWNNSERLVRIASGASSSDYNWTEVLMKNIPHNLIEAIALHHYSVIDWGNKGSAKDFTEDQYFTIMKRALHMEELIQKHVAIMDKYDKDNRVALFVDEWGGWYDVEPGTNPGFLYQQNTMRDAMIAGATLNIFNNHADRVKMANLAQAVNVLQAVVLTDEEKMLLTPTYHVMRMYNVHQDARLIPLSFDSPEYTFNDESLPAVSASASIDDNNTVHCSLVNIDAKKIQSIEIDVSSLKLKTVSGEILTSGKLQDHNTFDNPNKVQAKSFNEAVLNNGKLQLSIPPFSVVVITAN